LYLAFRNGFRAGLIYLTASSKHIPGRLPVTRNKKFAEIISEHKTVALSAVDFCRQHREIIAYQQLCFACSLLRDNFSSKTTATTKFDFEKVIANSVVDKLIEATGFTFDAKFANEDCRFALMLEPLIKVSEDHFETAVMKVAEAEDLSSGLLKHLLKFRKLMTVIFGAEAKRRDLIHLRCSDS